MKNIHEEEMENTYSPEDLIEFLNIFFISIDEKDTDQMNEMLADKVDLDCGEIEGEMPLSDVINFFTKDNTITHHQISNHLIDFDNDTARAFFYYTKVSKQDETVSTSVGYFDLLLQFDKDDWKIIGIRLEESFSY